MKNKTLEGFEAWPGRTEYHGSGPGRKNRRNFGLGTGSLGLAFQLANEIFPEAAALPLVGKGRLGKHRSAMEAQTQKLAGREGQQNHAQKTSQDSALKSRPPFPHKTHLL